MRRVLSLLPLGLVLAHPAAALADAPLTGRLLVKLRPAAAAPLARPAAADAVVAAAVARRAGFSVAALRLVTVAPLPGESLRSLAARLRADPRVARVELERRARPRYVPNDPALTATETASGTAPATPVQWWAARSRFPLAWDISRGSGATVAVIDTGVDASHPDLTARIARTATFTDDGGGAVDEIGHGTHVASLACGEGDNGAGLAGAGLHCDLLVVKTDFTDSSVAAGIVWAVAHGADAINMSFGTDPGTTPSQTIRDALAYALEREVVLVAAAADADIAQQGYPADVLQPTGSAPNIAQGIGLSVTAADASNARAPFAGYGTQISLAAYGAYAEGAGPPGIFGAFTTAPNALDTGALSSPPRPPCGCRTTFGGDPRYGYLQGTSMAAPMVAAVGALIRHLNPDLPARRVVRLIKATAHRPTGRWTPDLGWGILDAGSALTHAAALDLRRPSSRVRPLPPTTRHSAITVRWRGRDTGPVGVRVSGIARYELYRSVDGRRARRLLTTTRHSARVRLHRGARSAFFTIAVDAAGNRERVPAIPDASVTRSAG